MPAADDRHRATTRLGPGFAAFARFRRAHGLVIPFLLLASTTAADVSADPNKRTAPSRALGANADREGMRPGDSAPRAMRSAPEGTSSCARRQPSAGATRAAATHQGSTVTLARSGASTLAYIAHEDDATVRTFDVDAGVQRAITRVAGAPSSLLVLADGRVAVALRDAGRVVLLEPGATPEQPLTTLCALEVAAEPVGLATTPDDATLLVTSGWGRRLTAFDVSRMSRRLEVPLPREPRALVTDDAGERAFVAHVVGARMSVVDLTTGSTASPGDALGRVRNVDLSVRKQIETALDGRPQHGCQGFALAKSIAPADVPRPMQERPLPSGKAPAAKPPAKPSSSASSTAPAQPTSGAVGSTVTPDAPRGRIYAPMVTVDPGNGSTSAGYGGDGGPAERPMISVVDARGERALTRTVFTDRTHRASECLLPRAAVYAPGSETLLVTCLGIDAVVELDARGVDPGRLERRRWAVPAGPTGIALDTARRRAVVWSQFHGSVSVIDLDGNQVAAAAGSTPRRSGRQSLAPARSTRLKQPVANITASIARGRVLFHQTDDTRISRDGRACASCHPDGRDDALTWSTPDGPRQTIMLAGRTAGSAPFGWSGEGATLRDHVRSTLERLRGRGLASNQVGHGRSASAAGLPDRHARTGDPGHQGG
jgi:DNA-binding beta-propeller fold protein YncE